jgi:hypothetical protein
MAAEYVKKYPNCTRLLQHLTMTSKILLAFLEAFKADDLRDADNRID